VRTFPAWRDFKDPLISPVKEVEEVSIRRQWEHVFEFFGYDSTVIVIEHCAATASIGPRNEEAIEMIVIEVDSVLDGVVQVFERR
jgi:hypothetical protein